MTNEHDSSKIVVLGLDKNGTPHAARFQQADTVLAKRAAEITGLRMIIIKDPALMPIAASLPEGRVLRGNAIVPAVAADVYAKLTALTPPDAPEVTRSENSTAKPASRSTSSPPDRGKDIPARFWDKVAVATSCWATSAASRVGGRSSCLGSKATGSGCGGGITTANRRSRSAVAWSL